MRTTTPLVARPRVSQRLVFTAASHVQLSQRKMCSVLCDRRITIGRQKMNWKVRCKTASKKPETHWDWVKLPVLSFEVQAKFLSLEKSFLLILRIVDISLPFESEIYVIMANHANLKRTDCRRQQRDFVREHLKAPLRKGDDCYLVDMAWFRRWKDYVDYYEGDTEHPSKQPSHPGRIDLSPLLAPDGVTLISGLAQFEHFLLVPLRVWAKLLEWYGMCEGQPVLRRRLWTGKKRGVPYASFKFEVELRSQCDGRSVAVTFSLEDSLWKVKQVMRRLFGVPANVNCRIWNGRTVLEEEHTELQELILFLESPLFIQCLQPDGTWQVV